MNAPRAAGSDRERGSDLPRLADAFSAPTIPAAAPESACRMPCFRLRRDKG